MYRGDDRSAATALALGGVSLKFDDRHTAYAIR